MKRKLTPKERRACVREIKRILVDYKGALWMVTQETCSDTRESAFRMMFQLLSKLTVLVKDFPELKETLDRHTDLYRTIRRQM